jgi:hypothetical protein
LTNKSAKWRSCQAWVKYKSCTRSSDWSRPCRYDHEIMIETIRWSGASIASMKFTPHVESEQIKSSATPSIRMVYG